MAKNSIVSTEDIIRRLESYCAYQERCYKEVVQKLRSLGAPHRQTDQVVVHLINQNFLNEERFAQNFARGKFNIKKWGRNRIVAELKQRDISDYNIASALKELDETAYQESFNTLALKRLGQLTEKDRLKKRKKLADYLLYRGWEGDLVYQKIAELIP